MANNVIEWSADDLVPAQWYGGVYAGRPQLDNYTGLQKLSLAVLLDAARDIGGRRPNSKAGSTSRARRRDEAIAWLNDDDADPPFAFRNVCEVLALNPESVRARLRGRLPRLKQPPVVSHRQMSSRR